VCDVADCQRGGGENKLPNSVIVAVFICATGMLIRAAQAAKELNASSFDRCWCKNNIQDESAYLGRGALIQDARIDRGSNIDFIEWIGPQTGVTKSHLVVSPSVVIKVRVSICSHLVTAGKHRHTATVPRVGSHDGVLNKFHVERFTDF